MKSLEKIKHCGSVAVICVFLFALTAEAAIVVPCGKTVGVKIYTEGLLVVGIDGKTRTNPAAQSGIKTNDIILKAQNTDLKSTEELTEIVQNNPTGVKLTIKRGDKTFDTSISPEISEDGTAHIGLWLRDSTAGIGTVTYINPEDMTFAALGHGICDIDTGNILSVKSGNILNCNYLSVVKSKKGSLGEISGSFGGKSIGCITKNTSCGIFGTAESDILPENVKVLSTARRDEVRRGKANILSDFDGSGVKQYEIEITKISPNADDKAIVFKVTDKELLEKTGGIVQGMSGSPIIQSDKIVGAVTHVLVNAPTSGYGIFIENMLDAAG